MADRLTVSQAGDYIPCGISTLNKLRVSGGGPRFIKIGGRVLYDVRDLDKWLENCKRYSTSDQAA
jgi:Helix-turn-helix domain